MQLDRLKMILSSPGISHIQYFAVSSIIKIDLCGLTEGWICQKLEAISRLSRSINVRFDGVVGVFKDD